MFAPTQVYKTILLHYRWLALPASTLSPFSRSCELSGVLENRTALCSYTSLKLHTNSFQHTGIATRVPVQWQRLWLMICKDLICCKEDITQTTKELHTSACVWYHIWSPYRPWTLSANLFILADFATFLCRKTLPLKDNISSNSFQQSI